MRGPFLRVGIAHRGRTISGSGGLPLTDETSTAATYSYDMCEPWMTTNSQVATGRSDRARDAPLMTRVAVTRMRQGDADDDACPAEPATDFYLPACVFYTAQCARARAECGRTGGRIVGVGAWWPRRWRHGGVG